MDFDGVLFDHIPWMLRAFRDTYGIDLAREGMRHWDLTAYEQVRKLGLTYECVRRMLDEMETDPIVHQSPLKDPYARKVIRRWRRQGHEVFVVTARVEASRSVTEEYLRQNLVAHDGLLMDVQLKTGYDVLVDDAPHNALAASDAGGLCLLMDQPYNQALAKRPGVLRVYDWMDVDYAVANPPAALVSA